MKNRTNQTLSALASSTRLNRGTRSLATQAGSNHGKTASSIRQSHHGVMCDVMEWNHLVPILTSALAIPPIPCLFSPDPRRPDRDRLADRDGLSSLGLGGRSSWSRRCSASSPAAGLKRPLGRSALVGARTGAPES